MSCTGSALGEGRADRISNERIGQWPSPPECRLAGNPRDLPCSWAVLRPSLSPAGPVATRDSRLFNRPPLRQLHARYDFEPTSDWLEHLQKSCVRFNEGGSGSFVSADGLVMANQHVGADVLPRLGDKDHNYYRDGFYAKTRDQEIRCDGLELDVLMSIDDVTARVKAVLKSKMTPEETAAALRGDGGNRGRICKKNRLAERGRQPVPGERVSPLPIPPLHGRARCVCPRAAVRVFRRRPR